MVEEKVREGYKRTEVGVIPEDWEIKNIKSILNDAKLGGNYKNSEKSNGHPLIKMGNIGRGNISLEKIEYIDENEKTLKIHKLQYGDVLFNTRNTLELVGKVAIWRDELEIAYYNSNLLKLDFNESIIQNSFYMNYIFNTKKTIDKLNSLATGTTSVAAIYTRDLNKLLVPIPPLKEQKAIAEVLSDTDNLITSLQKLINKKEKIKKGAMQKLLTGEERLPGFDGEWEEKELGDIAEINMGQSPKSKFYNNKNIGLPLIQGNADIKNRKTIIRNFTSNITKICSKEDIIMTVRAPVGRVAKAKFKACIGRGVCSISYSNDFLFQYLIFIETSWSKLSTGSTFKSINSNNLKNIELMMPKLEEQKAIAQILSDMDAEIEALNKKLEKYKKIKQGMMEELLTGRIRLV